jgi:hypothetical protein
LGGGVGGDAGLVAPGGVIAQALRERRELLEIVKAMKLIFRDLRSLWHCHTDIMRQEPAGRNANILLICRFFLVANGEPNGIGVHLTFFD